MATGIRLGSPATAANPSLPGSWLERFMNGARARDYRVDSWRFIDTGTSSVLMHALPDFHTISILIARAV
jgi:hypothetical protein